MQRIDKSIMHTPLPKLFEVCQGDFEIFTTVLSLAINIGIRLGSNQAHRYYNQMFRDYKEVSIRN